MNIMEPNNLYSSLKEIISDRKISLLINNFKSTKGGNNNNNNNTTINRERIDANFNKIYILPEGSKWEKRT